MTTYLCAMSKLRVASKKTHRKEETSVSTVQPTEYQTKRSKVATIEELTVEETKDAHFREATTKVRISASKFYVDRNGTLMPEPNIYRCVQKMELVSLGEPILHVEQLPQFLATQVSDACIIQ